MLNIQPVIPVKLTDDWNLINRPIVPIIWQPDGYWNAESPSGGPVTTLRIAIQLLFPK